MIYFPFSCQKSVEKKKKTGCSHHDSRLAIQRLKNVHRRLWRGQHSSLSLSVSCWNNCHFSNWNIKKRNEACWSMLVTLNDNCLAVHMKEQKGKFSIKQRVMKITGVKVDTFRGFVIPEHIIEIVSAMQAVCLSAAHTYTTSWVRHWMWIFCPDGLWIEMTGSDAYK